MSSQVSSTVVAPAELAVIATWFLSADTGWVLETVGSASSPPVLLFRTGDAGSTWTSVRIPAIRTKWLAVRFADASNGWLYGDGLWSTHDGGATWQRVALPGLTGTVSVSALETAAGLVHVSGLDDATIDWRLFVSPIDRDGFVPSPSRVPQGAGPVIDSHIVVQGNTGWMIHNDRTVMGGARLQAGHWVNWRPPCMDKAGPGLLAAARNGGGLVAVCNEEWVPAGRISVHVYVSHDGGDTLTPTAALPGSDFAIASVVARPQPGTIIVGYRSNDLVDVLVATRDEGATWTELHRLPKDEHWSSLEFTTPNDAVAIISGPNTLMATHDAGQHWRPLDVHSTSKNANSAGISRRREASSHPL